MPALKMSFSHQLGRQTAQERLQTRLEKLLDRYGSQVSNLRQSWTDNVLDFGFTTYGFGIQGNVTVEENEVRLDGQIPFAAMMFKGKIEQALREQITKVLA
ncbi:MAG: polyhydroxyalkanoic acid system family protein [Pirellulales bacterium]